MKSVYVNFLCDKLGVKMWQVEQGIALLGEGATVPFIARYRKERTGGMDEAQLAELKHWHLKFQEMEKRKASILETIQEKEQLTPALQEAIEHHLQAAADCILRLNRHSVPNHLIACPNRMWDCLVVRIS